MNQTQFEVVERPEVGRFELLADGEVVGFADYHRHRSVDSVVVVPHVETLSQHRGQGYAARLVDGLLAILRTTDRKVIPRCTFAAQHIADNANHHDLLAPL